MADVGASASELIDQRIADMDDWRGATLRTVREVIRRAVPEVVEEWKWVKATSPGTPVWSHHGHLCTGEVYKKAVKLTSRERPCPTRLGCSRPAWTARSGAPSTSSRARSSTRWLSPSCSGRPLRSMPRLR
jgi:hypothetical protein